MVVLGIETSCDETGIAIYCSERGLLAHALHSQINTHQNHGGVVPELASRDHLTYLLPLVENALQQAGMTKQQIGAVAYTAGPGLIGALLTGACFAKSFAYALQVPALAVHHLEAHLLAAQLGSEKVDFPFIVLLVSGGHTQLIEAKALGEYQLLGDTVDDAVGEAFDKTAKLIGIPYPGGARLAQLADERLAPNQQLSAFPRPMIDRPGLDFSFSGLKTHALNRWLKSDQSYLAKQQIANAFQEAVVDTLSIKCQRALEQTQIRDLVVAGGVGANVSLRNRLCQLADKIKGRVFFPPIEYCTDNGAMVAYAGHLHFLKQEKDKDLEICVRARWPLS